MLSINQLIKYLRNHHHITVKSNQAQSLRNIGYYHGYKGYRFIRTPNQRIPFSSLDEVIALNKFDMQLKTIIYPKVMFIENALKSYVIEAILHDCRSENLEPYLTNLLLTINHIRLEASNTTNSMQNG